MTFLVWGLLLYVCIGITYAGTEGVNKDINSNLFHILLFLFWPFFWMLKTIIHIIKLSKTFIFKNKA